MKANLLNRPIDLIDAGVWFFIMIIVAFICAKKIGQGRRVIGTMYEGDLVGGAIVFISSFLLILIWSIVRWLW